MTKSQYLSLQDAALLVNKSAQTIRRLIKGNKIRYRKYKTPQGFTYLVEKSNLIHYFESPIEEEEDSENLEEAELVEEFDPGAAPFSGYAKTPPEPISYAIPHHSAPPEVYEMARAEAMPAHREPIPNEQPSHHPPTHASVPSNGHVSDDFPTVINQLVQHHREDKKRLFELLETFQRRILILEDHIKQLEAPKSPKRRRFFFF